jgi:DNA-binding NtrC family response regulator
MRRILFIDDKAEEFAESLRIVFPEDRLAVARSGREALALLARGERFDLAILDVRMPADLGSCDEEEGLAVLAALREERPELPVILLSVLSDLDTVVRGMRLGAFWYVQKPPVPKHLRHLADLATRQSRGEEERRALRATIDLRDSLAGPAGSAPRDRLGALVGASPPMLALYDLVERVAPREATVLILGETGSGKELVAREIHRLSPRAARPLRTVNCPAIPKELVESTLFGHRRGAFTGAVADRRGEFEEADGSTLFLDEVGELDLPVQAKLLRALESGEFTPLGASEPRRASVRLVAATHRDLRAEVAAGRFREDLYYRLNVVPVRVPPLRERPEDLPRLVPEFLRRAAPDRPRLALTPEALRRLAAHAWPGNVRELRNVLDRAAVLARGDAIGESEIVLDAPAAPAAAPTDPAAAHLSAALDGRPPEGGLLAFRNRHGEDLLRELLRRALRWTGDIRAAGHLLGFIGPDAPARDYDNLRQWMKKLDLSLRTALAGR